MNKQIEIIVDTKGAVRVETKGFTGCECVEASKFVEQALGKQIATRTTPEFFTFEKSRQQVFHGSP